MPDLTAIFRVKNRNRKRSGPPGQHQLPEGFLSSRLFSVVGEDGLVARKEPPHQDQIAVIVEIHTDNFEPLRGVLLGELIQHRVFVPAGLAPRRPKIHKKRFPAVLLHKLLVSLRVDEFRHDLEEEPPDPRKLNSEVPDGLATVILKAMAKQPADRYATASEMHDALARIG